MLTCPISNRASRLPLDGVWDEAGVRRHHFTYVYLYLKTLQGDTLFYIIVCDLYAKCLVFTCLPSSVLFCVKYCFLSLSFSLWLLLVRDFQFGHMDGNDYINSLLME